jgi:hypothetical protein
VCVLERRDSNKHTQASERERFVCGCLDASEGGGEQCTTGIQHHSRGEE